MERLFYKLASKVITGDASNAESQELKGLIEQRPELASEFDSLKATWEKSGETELPSYAEEDWPKVQARLKEEVKPRQSGSISVNRWLSIAASLALIVAASFLIWNSMRWEHVTATAGNLEIQLPDKSVVTLRKGSRLTYHYRFAENRQLELNGEAYFEVAKDPFHPFEINSGNTLVRVLGTAFNVDTEPGNGTEVYVKEGRVRFSAGDAQMELGAGEAARYSESNNSIESLNYADGNRTSWPKQQLKFANQNLQQVLADIEHYFNIKIDRQDVNLDCGFTGKFENPQLSSVLKTLERTLSLEFEEVSPGQWVIKSGGCQ